MYIWVECGSVAQRLHRSDGQQSDLRRLAMCFGQHIFGGIGGQVSLSDYCDPVKILDAQAVA